MSEEEPQVPVEERNRVVVERFTEKLRGYAKEVGADPERCGEVMEHFEELYEMWVGPDNRDEVDPVTEKPLALAKAMRIAEIARKKLGIPEDEEEVDGKRVRILPLIDEKTKTKTYNVVVTLGDPSSGPNVYLDAHFDSVAREKKERTLSLSGEGAESTITGPGTQDNAIHLAAALEALGQVGVPESGAIHFVLDDHEEDGIRGARPLAYILLKEASKDHPIILIANESTEEKLIFAHRGKDKNRVESDEIVKGKVGDAFIEYYRVFASMQQRVFEKSIAEESKLGPTAGTSVVGSVTEQGVRATYDIRTNEVAGVDVVRETFSELFDNPDSELRLKDKDLLEKAFKAKDKGNFELRVVGNRIEVTAHGALHPSSFNPENDDTVMSGIFLALGCLDEKLRGRVNLVSWGDKLKQNSNPMQATIEFDGDVGLTQEDLEKRIESLREVTELSVKHDLAMRIVEDEDGVTIGTVVSPEGGKTEELRQKFSEELGREVEIGVVGYMTSNGPIYNMAMAEGREVYAYVYGIGLLKDKEGGKLHSLRESFSVEDVVRLVEAQTKLVQAACQVAGMRA